MPFGDARASQHRDGHRKNSPAHSACECRYDRVGSILAAMASALAKQLTETVESYRRNTTMLKQQKRGLGSA